MASDITLAVGDGARRMTHGELAQGISYGADPGTESRPDEERPRPVAEAPENGSGADPLAAIGLQTLSQVVEMLREDVEHERDRADRAERQVEVERRLVEEGRKRVDGLLIELADARTAAMISGCEGAVLRTQLAMLTDRRPWWCRWFR